MCALVTRSRRLGEFQSTTKGYCPFDRWRSDGSTVDIVKDCPLKPTWWSVYGSSKELLTRDISSGAIWKTPSMQNVRGL